MCTEEAIKTNLIYKIGHQEEVCVKARPWKVGTCREKSKTEMFVSSIYVAIIYIKISPPTKSKYRKYAIKSLVYKQGHEEVVIIELWSTCRVKCTEKAVKKSLMYRIGHQDEVCTE